MHQVGTSGSKLALITGANSGLGLACVKAFLSSPHTEKWHVLMACRNSDSAIQALEHLQVANANKIKEHTTIMSLDLSSLDSIRAFEREFASQKQKLPPLKALICNAATAPLGEYKTTKDGFESSFGVNHLGHFLLTNLMLRHLVVDEDSSVSRVMFVSSGAHDPHQKGTGMLPPLYTSARDLAYQKPPSPPASDTKPKDFASRAYTTSKLCNLLCTYELSRRLVAAHIAPARITVNAFDPGFMPGTGLVRDDSALVRFGWNWIMPTVGKLFLSTYRSTDQSADALVTLATNPAVENVTGKYFAGLEETRSSEDSYDAAKATDLWNTSIELVKLTPQEAFAPFILPAKPL